MSSRQKGRSKDFYPNTLKHKLTLTSEHFSTESSTSPKTGLQEKCQSSTNGVRFSDVGRLGAKTVYCLAATTVLLFGLCGLLAYLWFGSPKSELWKRVMINGWATRSVTVIALALRSAVDVQVAICSAIIASLLLESRHGVSFQHLATLSPVRASATSLWTLTRCAFDDLWSSSSARRRYSPPAIQ